MFVMKVEDYILKMKSLGWSDQHIDNLINIYLKCFLTDDGRIKVFAGDFDKKNIRLYNSVT